MKRQNRKQVDYKLNCSDQIARALIKNMKSQNEYVIVNYDSDSDIYVELKWENHGNINTEYIYEANIVNGILKGELYTPLREKNNNTGLTVKDIAQITLYSAVGIVILFGLPFLFVLLIFHNVVTAAITGLMSFIMLSILLVFFTDHKNIHMTNLNQFLSPLVSKKE